MKIMAIYSRAFFSGLCAVTLCGCFTQFNYYDDITDVSSDSLDEDGDGMDLDLLSTDREAAVNPSDSETHGTHADTGDPEDTSGSGDSDEPRDISPWDPNKTQDSSEPEDTTEPEDTGEPQEAITITHSASQNVLEQNSIACIVENGGPHLSNSYYRVFDLAEFGITSDFKVTRVEVGIEFARGGILGVQPASARLHTLDGPFTALSNLKLLKQVNVFIKDKTTAIERIPIQATAPAGSTLVVEFHMPSGNEMGNILRIGSNRAGETGPTFLVAQNCSVSKPTPIVNIETKDLYDVHTVMNVIGTHVP